MFILRSSLANYVTLTGEEHAVLSHTHNNLQELMLQRHGLPRWTLLQGQRHQIQLFHCS